ncbi:MAG: hypothetical protein KBT70_17385, partial [Roseovarius sp.]|uniref:hypothetical protein n=1 Tax=Roseovarius sp. TaxID=1486281 RepID=UPI001B59F453
PLRYADHVSSYDVSFLTGSSFAVFASAAQVGFFLESQSRFKSDDPEPLITTGNLIVTSSGTNQLSVGTADFSVEIEIPGNPEIPFIHNTIDYYAWLHFRYFVDGEPVGGTSSGNGFVFTTAVEDIPTFENVEDNGDWFIAGASLDGTSIVSNGSFSTTIQVPGAADSADSSQTQSANAGSNQTNFGASFGGVGTTTTYSGFNAGVGALVVSGAPINPNAPPIDVTISQAGNDVLVSGATASLILQDVQLSEWQAVASTQLLGTSGTDDITGSSGGSIFGTMKLRSRANGAQIRGQRR